MIPVGLCTMATLKSQSTPYNNVKKCSLSMVFYCINMISLFQEQTVQDTKM